MVRIKIRDTRNFGETPLRYQNLIHSETNDGLKNEDTSISTRDYEAGDAAKGAPEGIPQPYPWVDVALGRAAFL